MKDPRDEIQDALQHQDFLERIDAMRGYDAAEKRLLDRLEAAEKEREELHALIAAVKKKADAEFRLRVKKEEACARLQAKVEAMEQQEPVAKVESWTNGSYTRHYKLKWLRDVEEGALLYALPGAAPEAKP